MGNAAIDERGTEVTWAAQAWLCPAPVHLQGVGGGGEPVSLAQGPAEPRSATRGCQREGELLGDVVTQGLRE